jgi:hypothetical protein
VVQPGGAAGQLWGCARSRAAAAAVPYRVVTVLVVACGAGQLTGSDSARWAPCLRGRRIVPGGRGGARSCMTRSERSRPGTCAGRPGEQERQPGHVVADVDDDQDGRIVLPSVPGLDQPGEGLSRLSALPHHLARPRAMMSRTCIGEVGQLISAAGQAWNPAGTAAARRVTRHQRHHLASCPSRPSLMIMGTRNHRGGRTPARRHAGSRSAKNSDVRPLG